MLAVWNGYSLARFATMEYKRFAGVTEVFRCSAVGFVEILNVSKRMMHIDSIERVAVVR